MGANRSCSYSSSDEPSSTIRTTEPGEEMTIMPSRNVDKTPEASLSVQEVVVSLEQELFQHESLISILNALTQTRQRIEMEKAKEQELLATLIRKYESIYSEETREQNFVNIGGHVIPKRGAELSGHRLKDVIMPPPPRRALERRTSNKNLFRRRSMEKWTDNELSNLKHQLMSEINRQSNPVIDVDDLAKPVILSHIIEDNRTRSLSPTHSYTVETINTIATESADRDDTSVSFADIPNIAPANREDSI